MEDHVSQKITEPMCPLGHGRVTAWRTVDGYRLVRCPSCGIGFVFPTPSATEDIYQMDYFQGAKQGFGYTDYDAEKQATVTTLRTYLAVLKKWAGTTGTLLDVGAASGFFVEVARSCGWQAEGVEISAGAVALAQQKGRPVTCAPFTDAAMASMLQFDAMTMLDVLEHVPDPVAAIRIAHAHLADSGVLLVNVPDAGSWFARAMGSHWQALVPPEHLTYFTRRSLSELLQKNGFEVAATHAFAKRFRIRYIVATVFRRWKGVRDLMLRITSGRFGEISVPLPIGDNLLVVARKV